MEHAKLYHIGCAQCVITEKELASLMDSDHLDVINLSEERSRVEEAIMHGVKSVPALITPNGLVLHLNVGMQTDDLAGVAL